MRLFPKKRKPRGIKLNGHKSYDMCDGCYMPHCDPFAASPAYREKIYKRLHEGKCPACGQVKCKCKSTSLSPAQYAEKMKRMAKQRKEFLEEQNNIKEEN